MPDVNGEPFDFAARTAGQLTFLFFGYTYCPDVCPIHMASLAEALRGLSYQDRQRVSVVFVTVDPERDSPERLREWLADFDPTFVGLRGPVEQANQVAARLMLPGAAPDPGGGGGYTVGHAAAVVAFSPSGPAKVLYPFGTRREDWVHDLPILLGSGAEAAAGAATAIRALRTTGREGVQVLRAFVTRSPSADAAALYAVLANGSASADQLVAVDAPAARTELHQTVRQGEGAALHVHMQPVAQLDVPAGGELRLAPGGNHVMLLQPALAWMPGDTVTVVFRFASGAARTVQAPVVGHAQVERLLESGS
jgi:protein SCO1/2